MINRELIQALLSATPALCALACLTMIAINAPFAKKGQTEKRLPPLIMLIFAVAACYWSLLTAQVSGQSLFAGNISLSAFLYMLNHVLIFRFVRHITADPDDDTPFNRLHYIAPALLTVLWITIELTDPFRQPQTFIRLNALTFVIYDILYPALSILRINRYRRNIADYSADTQRASLNWLITIQALLLITLPSMLVAFLFGSSAFLLICFTDFANRPTAKRPAT
jgi:hypothetical protein